MVTKTVYQEVEVEVDIDLDQFDDDELIEEIEARDLDVGANLATKELITKIFHNRRVGQPYENLLDELIYEAIGRVV